MYLYECIFNYGGNNRRDLSVRAICSVFSCSEIGGSVN